VDAILAALDASKNPAVLVDVLAHRFNAAPEARTLVSKLRVPIYTTNMGKGIIDETEELYVGVYNGAIGTPGVQEAAETTDMMVTLGLLAADTNSGGFSRKLEEDKTIHIHPFSVVVRNSLSSPLLSPEVLTEICRLKAKPTQTHPSSQSSRPSAKHSPPLPPIVFPNPSSRLLVYQETRTRPI
jgi:pyruvate decarboxylase